MSKLTPDRDSRDWWLALDEGRLTVQRCSKCGDLRWAPRAICPTCVSTEFEWQAVSGKATVVSWMTSHRTYLEQIPAPYTVVLARLKEADTIMIPAGWAGDPRQLAVGAAVTATFHDLGPEGADEQQPHTLLRWAPVGPDL